MKQILKTLLLGIICYFTINTLKAQEVKNGNLETTKSIKPLRVGVKVGIPSITTLNLEYVSPILENRVALYIDYLPIKINASDLDLKLRNFEIGSNIYLNDTGNGLYAGLGYYSFNTEAGVVDVDFDDGSFGDGNTTLKFNTVNLKIGFKTKGVFYSRIEVGYAFGSLPDRLVITSTDGNSFTTEPIEDISVLSSSGLPLINIGFGFSFL